jgi:formate hydrogenlyase subunit 3/multisubunit Na+/H+ antiporter MnhD subunit
MALGLGTRAGAEQSVQLLVWRAFSLLLVGVGWGALFSAANKRDDLEQCAAPVRRHPLGVVAMVLGLLSLAGFPLTLGGFGRWPLLDRAVLNQPLADWPTTTLVLVSAAAAASVGIVGALGACVGTRDDGELTETEGGGEGENGGKPENRKGRRRRTLEMLLSAGMSLLALWLIGGFFLRPGPWIVLARRLVGKLTFPGG